MPRPEDLPETLRPFATRNAFEVAHHKFASDVAELANVIMRSLGIGGQKEPRTDLNVSSSWADDLLSFRGRISRKRFWLWMLALTPLTALLQFMLVLIVGGSIKSVLTQDVTFQHALLMQVGVIPFWWFCLALGAKRLHDFNAGSGSFVAVLVLTVLFMAMYFLSVMMGADSAYRETKEFAAFTGMYSGFSFFVIFVWVAIGLIPGTPGPNRYGLST